MAASPGKGPAAGFTAVPSSLSTNSTGILVISEAPTSADAVGFLVREGAALPSEMNTNWQTLERGGFTGAKGDALMLLTEPGSLLFAVGAGRENDDITAASLRDVAAAFARATARFSRIAVVPGDLGPLSAETIGQCITEGVLLARYRYTELMPSSPHVPLISLDIVVPDSIAASVYDGVKRGEILSRVTNIVRDLVNTPPDHLTAARFADIAVSLGEDHALTVEVFGPQQLADLQCGGLLGVNAGSVEEARMIKLSYTPDNAGDSSATKSHLALVGKGIMYDSGGISLKPSDESHLAMKMDMAGAAAVFGAMIALRDVGCTTSVTGYLMCTDNMPSGSAVKLGDVLTTHNGMTVEVKNTDAEGRLVMSDALAMAAELEPDAIVDIATLTGASLMALGPSMAAVLGNNQGLIDQLRAAASDVDEPLWQLPLIKSYRPQLNSEVADISNMAGKYAGATTAALFLEEFVAGIPWGHLDIAGTMRTDSDDSWRSVGATGFGTRLLIEFALAFAPPSKQ